MLGVQHTYSYTFTLASNLFLCKAKLLLIMFNALHYLSQNLSILTLKLTHSDPSALVVPKTIVNSVEGKSFRAVAPRPWNICSSQDSYSELFLTGFVLFAFSLYD